MNVVYVTGNENKARLFNKMVGIDLPHEKVDIEEIQSLDHSEVVEHKAKSAYALLNKPVIVEDTQLTFNSLGRLPGPYIRWFLEEIGDEGLCRILDSFEDRGAIASCCIGYFDGTTLQIFQRSLEGSIAQSPGKGTTGFGWDTIFIPKGEKVVRGDMDEEKFYKFYALTKPFDELAAFLRGLDPVVDF